MALLLILTGPNCWHHYTAMITRNPQSKFQNFLPRCLEDMRATIQPKKLWILWLGFAHHWWRAFHVFFLLVAKALKIAFFLELLISSLILAINIVQRAIRGEIMESYCCKPRFTKQSQQRYSHHMVQSRLITWFSLFWYVAQLDFIVQNVSNWQSTCKNVIQSYITAPSIQRQWACSVFNMKCLPSSCQQRDNITLNRKHLLKMIDQGIDLAQLDFSTNPNRFIFWPQNRNTLGTVQKVQRHQQNEIHEIHPVWEEDLFCVFLKRI